MPREHQPYASEPEHSPYLPGGGGGGLTLAELLEVLAGTKNAKSIKKAALSEEVNELLGKGGPPSGAAGGDLAGTYPEPTIGGEKVTTGKIKLLALTTALFAEEAITAIKLAAESVTTPKIALEAITSALLGPEAVTTGKVKLLAITTALLAAEAVTEAKIAKAVLEKIPLFGTAYSTPAVARKSGDEWTPSATKYVYVSFELTEVGTALGNFTLQVGGITVWEGAFKMVAGEKQLHTILVPPNVVVKLFALSEGSFTCKTRELL